MDGGSPVSQRGLQGHFLPEDGVEVEKATDPGDLAATSEAVRVSTARGGPRPACALQGRRRTLLPSPTAPNASVTLRSTDDASGGHPHTTLGSSSATDVSESGESEAGAARGAGDGTRGVLGQEFG